MGEHALFYPPSSAARYLSCPASAGVMYLYPNEQSEASEKGDFAHNLLENAIVYGINPDTDDPDMDLNVLDAVKWARKRKAELGKGTDLHCEIRLDIPYTEEFGTADLVFNSPKVLHVADFKNGYVPVEVFMNAQMMTYLLGAIKKFGEREKYFITVIQPNYNHIDGPIRTMEVSQEDVDRFIGETKYAVQYKDNFAAGKHCKKTYCPHRGTCATFHAWARNNAADAYFTSEINGIDDEMLSDVLEHAEVLHGWRGELRAEAMRRILQMDRHIRGYKVVKGRKQREFKEDEGRDAVYEVLIEMGYSVQDMVVRTPIEIGGETVYESKPLSVADAERMVKQKYKIFGRGKWKEVWDNLCKPHIREFSGSLTLERSTDGRPAHSRGSEFGSIDSTATSLTSSTSSEVEII